jgi:GTP-binding protein
MACSAQSGRGTEDVLRRALALADRAGERVATARLNKIVSAAVSERPPPARQGRRLRLYYAAQVGRRPPRLAIQVNDRKLLTRDWSYYLENRLREALGLEGVPLVIDFVPRKRREQPRGR